MRLRRRKFHATVQVQAGPSPIVIGLMPGFTFEADVEEARRLAWDLANAIELVQRGGASEC